METTLMDENDLPMHHFTGLRALGWDTKGRPVWPVMGGSEDHEVEGDTTDTDDEGSEGSEEDEKDTKPTKASSEKSKEDKVVPQSRFDKLTKQLQAADRRRTEAENELRQLKDKDLPEAEKLQRDLQEATERADKLQGNFTDLARKYAFLLETGNQKVQWRNPKAALRLAELEDLTINDDGSVEGIDEAVRELIKQHPYLVQEAKAEEEDDEAKGTKPKPRSGSPVGSGTNKAKKGNGALTDDELRAKFPALRI